LIGGSFLTTPFNKMREYYFSNNGTIPLNIIVS
jgi:hypothetical protein